MIPVDPLTGDQQTDLLKLNSNQTIQSLPVRVPKPPFCQVEVPANLASSSWEFQVVDQDNQEVYRKEGKSFSSRVMEWDGFQNGEFKIRVGPAYTPILTLIDVQGKKQRLFGEPIQLDAVQFEEKGVLYIEFLNSRLYERGSADFAPEMAPLLQAALNLMRQHAPAPVRLTVYENPESKAPTQRRLDNWRRFLSESLILKPETLNLSALAPKNRGEVTSIAVPLK
jgi:hypothetical protein